MARTTRNAVEALLTAGGDYDLNRRPSLTPFIDTANDLVDDLVVAIVRAGKTISDKKQELIERWLSAHFYQASDQGYTSKSTAGASGSFMGQTGMYLEATKYGQTAVSLDTTGILYSISSGANRRSAKGTWVGKPKSQQIDYVDRD